MVFIMSAPKPKSKLDEVAEYIFKDTDRIFLSEFQKTRYIRMTIESNRIDYVRAQKQRVIIYYLSGDYKEAKKAAELLIPYVVRDLKCFMHIFAISLRIGAYDLITNAIIKLSESCVFNEDNLSKKVLENLGSPLYLIADYQKGLESIERIHNYLLAKKNDSLLDSFNYTTNMRITYLNLNLQHDNMRRLIAIVEDIIFRHKLRIISTSLALPNDELLLSLSVNKPTEDIFNLNNELFDIAYENGLSNELNALSINFTYIDMDQLEYEFF